MEDPEDRVKDVPSIASWSTARRSRGWKLVADEIPLLGSEVVVLHASLPFPL